MTANRVYAWAPRLVLLDEAGVARALEALRATGQFDPVPTPWQVSLGVLRMWHRLLFRSDTVGTSHRPIRPGWRARLLAFRALRLPFLLRERAVAPLDFSGLLSGRERVIRHLLAAHHDQNQFAYDLELLSASPGALEELLERTRAVLSGASPRSTYLRDLVVFEGYHEELEAAAARALSGDLALSPSEANDPDISFRAYLVWCARQPETPAATLRALAAGRYSIAEGIA